MKERTRKIFIMIVMAALIVSLTAASFAALTYGRYTGGKLDEDSPYDDLIDFVGATAFEVSSPDAFINAINNGYSYIKIADDAEEPFVINNNVADVYTNLVLDVNGHVVVRNSRNPLLDVRRSISVVLVYDSSTDADGGFYNPVGSSLQTSGGTLTVGEGVYESGPKIEGSSSVTAENITDVFVRDGTRASATKYQKATAAAQLPKPGKDVYLDETYSGTKNDYLKDDTYLLYTVEKNAFVGKAGDTVGGTVLQNGQLYVNAKKDVNGTVTSAEAFSPICNVASCDFYYYYPVSEANEDGFYTYAVVYGYNDVKTLASNEKGAAETLQESGLVWPYAAIRSVEDPETQEGGVTHARGGEFKTHFGEESTYCIYSAGGTMTVGAAGSAGGPSFEAVGSGVCIAMTGASGNVSEGGSLTISGGTFSSRLGNTIEMENGNMTVTAGAFTKTDCKKGTGDKQLENQTAIISLTGGTLNVSGTKTGDTYSVTMTAGSSENGGTLENVFGIRAAGGGEISTTGVSFHIYGDYSAGVLSYDGKIDLGNDTVINVTQSDAKTDANNNNTLLTSAGVSSEQASGNEENPVNLSGNVTIASNGLGITARGVVNVKGGSTSTVTTERGTGIYVNNGQFKVDKGATINVNSTVKSGYSWTTPPKSETTNTSNIYNGVYVQGGSLVSEGTLNVTFTGVENEEGGTYLDQQIKSYAVRVEAAAAGDDTEVKITAGTIINQVQYDEQGKEIAGGGGGVLVNGGTVTLGKQEITNGVTTYSGPTVQTTGELLYTSWLEVVEDSWKYMLNKSGGHAVEVSGGSLTVHGGNYTAQQGNGILIRNTSQSQAANTVMINSGSFLGYNSGYYISQNNKPLESTERMVGPAASYGLNVMGHDLDVTINDGTFGETGNTGNSAASFFGTPVEGTSDEIKESRPQVAVHGGTFNANNADAISVFRFIDITFDGTASKISSNISNGDVASLSVQDDLLYKDKSNRGSTIAIQSGTFTGTSYGIWYACGYDKLSISGDATIEGSTGLQVASAPVENGIAISGGTITGKQDGIYYGSNGTAANGLLISGGTITGTNGSGLNLAGAPAASGAVTISGDCKITGSNHGVYYGARGAVNDGLLIEDGTITGTNGAGLYFAANPWQNNGGVTNNVAIVGGTFKGVPKEKKSHLVWENSWYHEGAIGSLTTGDRRESREGLGEEIKLNDILKTHTGDNRVGYVQNTGYNGNNGSSIADTVSGMTELTITSGIS